MSLQKKSTNKIFSLEEANNALLLIKPITRDILHCLNKIAVIKESYQDNNNQEKLQSLQLKLVHHLNELNGLNVNINNLFLGIIDFPMIKDEQEGYFSWKYGEEEICFYRDKDSDISERKYLYNITQKQNIYGN